ncbi:hypothetical protein [Sulfurimonas sp.]|uniref:hypothetical protein n=1 Tax=Sulfurimonas sp. TaxID=2022749 RepID=UPI003D0EF61D
MKKLILVVALCANLFAGSGLCNFYSKKVLNTLTVMKENLELGDIASLDVNFQFFTTYVDMAIINCDENKDLVDTKIIVSKKVNETIDVSSHKHKDLK